MEELLKIEKEVKFLPSINKWVVSLFCNRGSHSIYAAGHFHKVKEKAEAAAMAEFKKSLAFYREIEAQSEKQELTLVM